jgi:serine/threonine-protein kinase
MMEAIYGPDSNHVAHVLNEVGTKRYLAGDLTEAEKVYRRALKIHLDTLGPTHPDTLSVQHNLLGTIESSGRYAQALPQRLVLLGQVEAAPAKTWPLRVANQYDALGIDYRELGDLDRATAMTDKALALIEGSQGPDSPRSVTARSHLGIIQQLEGRYEESDAQFRQALAILGKDQATSYSACGIRQKIAQNQRFEHRPVEAVEQLQSLTRDACLLSLKETDNWRPQVLADLSEALLDGGDVAEATAVAEKAVAYARKAFVPPHYKLAMPLFALARAELAAGHANAAERLLSEALALRSPLHPPSDLRVLEVQVALSSALVMQGRQAEADTISVAVTSPLKASKSPYASDLLARLAKR